MSNVNISKEKVLSIKKPTPIEWGRNILNDSLYLGNANGNQTEIISTGTELPYSSELMKGFQLLPNKTVARIDIPIRVRDSIKIMNIELLLVVQLTLKGNIQMVHMFF